MPKNAIPASEATQAWGQGFGPAAELPLGAELYTLMFPSRDRKGATGRVFPHPDTGGDSFACPDTNRLFHPQSPQTKKGTICNWEW